MKIKRIIKDHEESGALNALVNIHAAIDEHTLLTKCGHLVKLLRLQGVDYECLDAPQLDRIARRFESVLTTLGEQCRVYQVLIKRDDVQIPSDAYDDPILQEAVSNRIAYLRQKAEKLYSVEIYFAVVYEAWPSARKRTLGDFLKTPAASLRQALSVQRTADSIETELDRTRQLFSNKFQSFVRQLPEELHAEVLDKTRAFTFLRRLLNYEPYKADSVRLKYDRFVDFQAVDSALECHQDHLRLDDNYVSVLSLKEPPSHTYAHMLRRFLEIPCNSIITTEWKRENAHKIRGVIHASRRHFHNVKSSIMNYLGSAQSQPRDMLIDDAAVAQVADLGACLRELEVNGRAFGQFSMTVVLYSKDLGRLRRSTADFFKVFAAHDAQLTEERYNLLNAWLAVLPGNDAYNLRRFWLLDNNYADLSFLFALHTGETRNAHLGAEYLAVLETNHGTPYFFNFHHGDIAHTFISGGTGSGKSFLLNFLLTHAQKYRPRICVFDLGGGYESVTRLFGGAHVRVGSEKSGVTINPFSLPPTKENLQFLFSFVKVLIESGAYRMSAPEERDLYDQIDNLYMVEPSQRRLFTLANMLGRELRAQLQKWIEGGQYGSVFDNAMDTLTFARFQAFDFEGMDKIPQVLEPLLFYILHRLNAAVHDVNETTTFKLFVIDEAWRFFHHPAIQQYIREALKTWRKKNAAMILATQSSDDLIRSEMLSVVVESCATKMFLANPDIDAKLYREVFHLNETEAALIARLIPKQQILIKRPDMAKVVNLNVGPKDYWLYTSSPYDRERRSEAFERYGIKEGLEILARSYPS